MRHKPLDSTKTNIPVDPWLFTRLTAQPRVFQLVDKEGKNRGRVVFK